MTGETTSRFKDVITSEEELRAIAGDIYPGAVTKVIDHLDEDSRAFIAHAPFLLLGSASVELGVEVSPKGDPAGFVKVLDERTLAIPDRPGNARMDTFRNVLRDPHVGMIFLVPGRKDTLRVSGRAQIVRDMDLRRSMAVDGKAPEMALVVEVDHAFFHCAKCVVRSGLWDQSKWPDTSDMQSLGAALIAAARKRRATREEARAIDDELAQDEVDGLY
jgi:PPOX class probable FMN-dependent enzyme